MIVPNMTILAGILNFGSLLLLSFLMLANPLKVNKKANVWFGLFHLGWAFFWVDEVAIFISNDELILHWKFIFRFLQYFTPMLLYFSVLFYTQPWFKFKKSSLLHLLFPAIYLMLLYVFYYEHNEAKVLNYAIITLMLSQAIVYALISLFTIRKHKKAVQKYASDRQEFDLSWLERIIIAILLILLVAIIYNILFSLESLNLFMNVVFLLLIFDIAYHSLRQKEIYPFDENLRDELIMLNPEDEDDTTKKKIIADEELIQLKTQLNQFMVQHKPYLDPDLNLVKLAEMVEIAPHRLSYLINTAYNKNFYTFINGFRIEAAKAHLLNPAMKHYSVLGLAYEAGFNSKTAFNNAFKKFTGLTPSEFKKRGADL